MKRYLLISATVLGFTFANAQVGFTENLGQFRNQDGKPAENVLFKACGTGPGIFITTTGLTYLFEQKRPELVVDRDEVTAATIDWSAIHMNLVGADIRKENVVMEDVLPGVNNYYYAHCPNGILGVRSYHKITIKEIYPGIDWIITADDLNGVAHDFLVHENGNHQFIRMRYEGLTEPIVLNEKNQLTLKSAYGTMYEGGLKVFKDGSDFPMTSYFNVNGNGVTYLIVRIGREEMLIDPPLQWDTTLASSGNDYGYGIVACRDNSLDVLGCGWTDGADFPVMNASQGTLSGQEDAVVYRLDASGNRLWSTYYGGTDIDNAKGIATDANGNAYITGVTGSSDLPVMSSLQANIGGGNYDAFIAKFNSTGVMQWASWRGGTGADFGTAITADDNGNCYAVGYTNSSVNFPVLNAIQPTKAGSAGTYDAFVMSFSTSQTMNWSTYYGGTDEDKFRAVALDPTASNIVIAGNTMSGNFPTAGTPFQLFNAQPWSTADAIIMKMSTAQSVIFASYCGGFEDDMAYGVTTDNAGNIYAIGSTISSDFPIALQAGAYVDSTIGSTLVHDAFIVKCNGSGTTLLWSTYLGGSGTDYGYGIGYDQYVGLYVTGNAMSTDFPLQLPLDNVYYQPTHGDGGNFNDVFMTWFDVNDAMAWSTYYGFGMSDESYSISIGPVGDIFITGSTSFSNILVAKFNSGLPTSTQVCGYGVGQTQPFPNPARDEVSIIFASGEGVATIQIHDITGRLIREQHESTYFGENWIRVNIADLAPGEYNLSVISSDRNVRHKFVKQ